MFCFEVASSRSYFVRLSVKSGRFVCSGHVAAMPLQGAATAFAVATAAATFADVMLHQTCKARSSTCDNISSSAVRWSAMTASSA
jgi:hypothetical protein